MTSKRRVLTTLILAASLLVVSKNQFGQTSSITRPVINGNDFSDITAGNNHTCAIKNNGSLYCWGLNIDGEIGIASNAACWGYNCVTRPTYVMTAARIEAG